jgi:protein tyrosine/serine phosphatase
MSEDRLYAFDGISNFRDFGACHAADGAQIAAGMLFRSGHLGGVTEADQARLDGFDIRFIIDLRRAHERAKQPSLWPKGNTVRVIASDDPADDRTDPPHIAFLRQAELTPEAVTRFMEATYRSLTAEFRLRNLFAAYFKGLDKSEGASLVHCAFGKDRTGIVCALAQIALGAPEDFVLADYELTNTAVDMAHELPQIQERYARLYQLNVPAEALVPIIGVRAPYLHAALHEMRLRHGSVEGYLDGLGADAAMRDRLRRRYLR